MWNVPAARQKTAFRDPTTTIPLSWPDQIVEGLRLLREARTKRRRAHNPTRKTRARGLHRRRDLLPIQHVRRAPG